MRLLIHFSNFMDSFSATKGTLTKNIEKAISQKDLDKLITCMKVYDVTRPSTTDPLSLEANQMIMFLQAQKCKLLT